MTFQGSDSLSPNGPGFNLATPAVLSELHTVVPRGSTSSSQIRTENPVIGIANKMENRKSLSGLSSPRSLRSRQVLENLAAENSRQADVLERMVTDLVKIKSELRAKNVRFSDQQSVIEKQSAELEQLRGVRQSDNQKSAELQQAINGLKTEIREKDLNLKEKDQLLQERESELCTVRDQLEQERSQRGKDAVEINTLQGMINDQIHTQRSGEEFPSGFEKSEIKALQQELQSLKAEHASALSQIETGNARAQQYLDELNQLKITKDAAQSTIDAETAKNQQYIQEIEQQNIAHKELQSQIEAREAQTQQLTQELNSLQASLETAVAETKGKLRVQEQLEASHANDLGEAIKMIDYFQKHSDVSAQKVKELEAEIRSLKQSPQRNHEVQEDPTTNAAIQDLKSPELPSASPTRGGGRNSRNLRRKPARKFQDILRNEQKNVES